MQLQGASRRPLLRHPRLTAGPAHDFFAAQPVADAAVFVARYITHNWADTRARQVLARLRAAARPDTVLLVIDDIQDHLCRARGGAAADVPGAAKPTAPAPLLPHVETAASHLYSMDMGVSTRAARAGLAT